MEGSMAEHHEHSAEHIVPIRVYVIIFLALLALTGLTVFVAYYDLGRWNVIVALAIAVAKALLVTLFFMHVKYSKRLTRISVLSGLFWFAIMVVLTLFDYNTRGLVLQ
jgi:cytochrome c oxidase subunit 4